MKTSQKRLIRLLFVAPLFCSQLNAYSQLYTVQLNQQKVMKPVARVKAYAFNPADVQVSSVTPFMRAARENSGYLLWLKPERLLSRFYTHANLPAKDSSYGGWESSGLAGHTLGHYLSACAWAYASNNDTAFKNRVDFTVSELARCQQARRTGYIGAIPGEDSLFVRLQRGEIKSSGFDLNGGWSPWYTVHKIMAGLADAYLFTGNKQALKVLTGMADWTATIVNPLSDSSRQKMLVCEYGGMNDVLAMLFSFTGNEKYLDLSYKFYDDFVMKELALGNDPLSGKHSNTNIPKAIGSARQYMYSGKKSDSIIASRLYDLIANKRSYVSGGNGNYEYLGEADKLNDMLSDATTETCCSYNMLKLTGHLFTWQPSAALGDYYERVLYNHILPSINPATGTTLYFTPLRMGGKKQFSDSLHSFTCCVGTGLENHLRYNDNIYYETERGDLYINLFMPSELNWKRRATTIIQKGRLDDPSKDSIIIRCKKSIPYTILIRKPAWAKASNISINGKPIAVDVNEEGFITIKRNWKDGDVIELNFSTSVYTESMPDNNRRLAFKYGPWLLAANLGDTMPDPVYGIPVLLGDEASTRNIARRNSNALHFLLNRSSLSAPVPLTPFYMHTNNYYSVYFDRFTPEEWNETKISYEAEKLRQLQVERRTVDMLRLGEMQPERDHKLEASEKSYVSEAFGRRGREARKDNYFSFNMSVNSQTTTLLCTYLGDDDSRSFDILVDSVFIATVELKKKKVGEFYDVEYAIPATLIAGKDSIRVTIKATNEKTAGRVFTCRTLTD